MRHIEVEANEFQQYLWPAIAFQPVEEGGAIDAHVRLLGKIKAVSSTEGSTRAGAVGSRSLDSDSYVFELEEDEWGRLKNALKSWRSNIAGGVLDEYEGLRRRIEDAEQAS